MITFPRRAFLTRISGLAAATVVPAVNAAVAQPTVEIPPISLEARRVQLVSELLAIQKQISPGAWDVRFDMNPTQERFLTFSKRHPDIVYTQ